MVPSNNKQHLTIVNASNNLMAPVERWHRAVNTSVRGMSLQSVKRFIEGEEKAYEAERKEFSVSLYSFVNCYVLLTISARLYFLQLEFT